MPDRARVYHALRVRGTDSRKLWEAETEASPPREPESGDRVPNPVLT